MPVPFPARFDGVCAADCDSRVHPGDIVVYVEGQLVHMECTARLLSRLFHGACSEWILLMRVLTVRQPWASAIVTGHKTVENRGRNIAGTYRGPGQIFDRMEAARNRVVEHTPGPDPESSMSRLEGCDAVYRTRNLASRRWLRGHLRGQRLGPCSLTTARGAATRQGQRPGSRTRARAESAQRIPLGEAQRERSRCAPSGGAPGVRSVAWPTSRVRRVQASGRRPDELIAREPRMGHKGREHGGSHPQRHRPEQVQDPLQARSRVLTGEHSHVARRSALLPNVHACLGSALQGASPRGLNPRPLAEPIPYRGALGLRNLAVNDPQTTARILAQIGAS